MLNRPKLIVSLALILFTASVRADSLVYVVTDTNQFGTVNLNTGAFHQIGADTPSQQFNLVPGPNGSLFSITADGNLESINTATGATTIIGATGFGGNVGSLAELGGILYATDGNNNLYIISATTGAASLIGPTGIPPIVFSPPTVGDESLYGVGGKLYATFDTFNLPVSSPGLIVPPALYQIDPSTGVATEVASTMLGISASVEANGIFYGFHEGLADPTCVGPAPVPCASAAEVFTLNLTNGNTSFVSNVDLSATAIYGASPVVPEPASLALAGIGMAAIVVLKRRRLFRVTKLAGAGASVAVVALTGMLISSPYGRAEDHKQQDEKGDRQKIEIGFRIAPVPLKLAGKDADLVGLGSYLVNGANDCNFCHSAGGPPNFNFAAGFNPYFGQRKKTDPATYLAGGTDFGPAIPGPGYLGPDIVSRNLTPDKTGLPEGGHTFKEFLEIMRTGIDLDHQHPTCKAISPTPTPANCIPAPVDGNLLQIMPWPDFQDMTDHDLRAIYEYLSAIPCIAGPPAPSPLHNDCK